MSQVLLDPIAWSRNQFEECDLGDERRTERLIKYASQMAQRPAASTTQQTEDWSDCKAAYRLFSREEVTFDAVIAPHNRQTHQLAPGEHLVISDTTELDFGYLREVPGLGRIGATKRRGFFLHSALVVSADGSQIIGLGAQELYTRPLRKVTRVSSTKRKRRRCETDVWGRVIDGLPISDEGVKLIHVCDAGADNFDIFCRIFARGDSCVIRAAQMARVVRHSDGGEAQLDDLLASAPILGTYKLTIAANGKQPARVVAVAVRSAPIVMPAPRTGVSAYVRKSGISEIPLNVVEVREINPPDPQDEIRWVLLGFEPAKTFEECWRFIEKYEKRPVIEEYHKGLKSGLRIESRQYREATRLAPVIALTCVQAVRLLQLRALSRLQPELPAKKVVPAPWIEALRLMLRKKRPLHTIRDFIRAMASLGGFLGRKADGEPGWQTIWHGFERLHDAIRILQANKRKSG
jgi:hypothetical protein